MDIMSIAMAKAMMGGGGSSGGGLFLITVDTTFVEEENESYYTATADKTLEQIFDAYNTGLLPIVRITGDAIYDESENPENLYLVGAYDDGESRYMVFSGADWEPLIGQDAIVSVRAAKVYFAEGENIIYCGGYYAFPSP